MGILWESYWNLIGILWNFYGIFMEFLWKFLWEFYWADDSGHCIELDCWTWFFDSKIVRFINQNMLL